MKARNLFILTAGIFSTLLIGESRAGLVITPTFTAAFNADFGANAAAAQAAWNAAASIFTSNFSDNIHINITVDATASTSPFGQSSTSLFSTSYANLRSMVVADAKSANDAIAIGVGGSMTAADPTGGTGTWFVTRSQAKAIGLIGDDLSNDGTTTFGAANPFSFSGTPAGGTYDFKGVAAHEISEVMGRLGFGGVKIASGFSLLDDFAYTGPGAKDTGQGPNRQFSINAGTTLQKLYNNASSNGLDVVDWAPGTNDAFNQFSSSGVVNPVSVVDLQLMDVIGYDLISVPEPRDTAGIFAIALATVGISTRKRTRCTA